MCFAPSAVVFGGIVIAGAFAVKYTGIMVLQVRSWKLLQYPAYLQTVRTVFCFLDDRFRLQISAFSRQNTFELIKILSAFHR